MMMQEVTSEDRIRRLRLVAATAGLLTVVGSLMGCATGGPGETAAPTSTELVDPTATLESESPEPTGQAPTPAPSETAELSETPAETKAAVTVALVGVEATGAGGVEVRSFVTDYIGDGECSITVTSVDSGIERVSATPALPDAQSTVCPTSTVSGLDAGTYRVTVTFENDTHRGVSAEQLVEVTA